MSTYMEITERNALWAAPVIVLVIAATVSLPLLKTWARGASGTLGLVGQPYIREELLYQLLTLGVTGLVLLATYLARPTGFDRFFGFGQIDAPVTPVKAIGINPGPNETWQHVGLNFAVVITAVTAVFIYLQAFRGNSIAQQNLRYLPWVLIFALSNAFVEEMITRFAVVAALWNIVPLWAIYLVSAAIFGLVHYFGTPGGIPGVLMAGFLGWFAAKSIGETGGASSGRG